jgi:glutathione synthase
MTLRPVALQMDAFEKLNQDWDNSLYLARAALNLGLPVFYYQPGDLSWQTGRIAARGFWLEQTDGKIVLGPGNTEDLSRFSVIAIRQDPPLDSFYWTNTYLLEKLPPTVMAVNRPQSIRAWPEKISVLDYPEFIPPTLITQNPNAIAPFFEQHGILVLKPLYWMAGKHIRRVDSVSGLVPAAAELIEKTQAPIVVQKFLPAIARGDKRAVILHGEVIGAFLRRVRPGHDWTVDQQLADEIICGLTAREAAIAEILAQKLCRDRIVLAGLDFIGEYLIEINVTSPAGILELSRYSGQDWGRVFWQKMPGLGIGH